MKDCLYEEITESENRVIKAFDMQMKAMRELIDQKFLNLELKFRVENPVPYMPEKK